MARQGFAALSLAVLLAVFEIGSCLRCYQCTSQQDATCGDPYKAPAGKHLVDCNTQDSINYNQLNLRYILSPELTSSVTGAPRYCHKLVLQTGATIRTCLDGNPTDIAQTCRTLMNNAKLPQTDINGRIKDCSVCDKDSCNGASSVSFSLPLATLALIATYLFCKQ